MHPKCARKVSGVSRNARQVWVDWPSATTQRLAKAITATQTRALISSERHVREFPYTGKTTLLHLLKQLKSGSGYMAPLQKENIPITKPLIPLHSEYRFTSLVLNFYEKIFVAITWIRIKETVLRTEIFIETLFPVPSFVVSRPSWN